MEKSRNILKLLAYSIIVHTTIAFTCQKNDESGEILTEEYGEHSSFEIAQAVYKKCDKDINFRFELIDLHFGNFKLSLKNEEKNAKFLGISYYVNYTKSKIDFEKEDLETIKETVEKPFISLIHINSLEVNIKQFTDTWDEVLFSIPENPKYDIYFNTTHNQNITSFFHNSETNSIVLGFSDLKIGVLNFEDVSEEVLVGEFKTKNFGDLVNVIDLDREIREEEDSIDFITGVAKTNFFLVSPNRDQIFKIDFETKEKFEFDNPIDNIQFLEIPFSKNREKTKNKIYNSKFLATGKYNHVNFIGDYTTLQPLRFFTLRSARIYLDLVLDSSKQTTDKVDAVEFYGYEPQSQYFLLSNKELPYVYLYTTTYDKFDDYEEIIKDISVLVWVEELSYVFYSNEGSECGFWNVNQFEGNPESKIEKCEKNHLTSIGFKMMVVDFLKHKGNEDLVFNIPLLALNEKTVLAGWNSLEIGVRPNNLTFPECKKPFEGLENHFISDRADSGEKNNVGTSNAVFSGLKICKECRIGVKEKIQKWAFENEEEINSYDVHCYNFEQNHFEGSWLNEVQNSGGKLLHQLSKCDYCYFNFTPYDQTWFHTYILQSNKNLTDQTNPKFYKKASDIPNGGTVLIYQDPFPEISYTDQIKQEELTYDKKGCATGFSPNDLGICQNCPSFKYLRGFFQVDQDFLEKEKLWLCSNCYTHRVTKFYDKLYNYRNIDPNFFFCLEFNPFSLNINKTQYETVKNVAPNQTAISETKELYYYEPGVISDYTKSAKVSQYRAYFRVNSIYRYISILTTFFGVSFSSQEERINDCLIFNFEPRDPASNSGQALKNGVSTIPGYTTIKRDLAFNFHNDYSEFLYKSQLEDPNFLSNIVFETSDYNYDEFIKIRHSHYYLTNGSFVYGCFSECKLGYYYNETSMSCLKCEYGCASCSNSQDCEKCIAGFRKVDKKCHKGCPNEYFSKHFNGECQKCSQGCQNCRDDLKIRKKLTELRANGGGDNLVFEGRCTVCRDDKLMIDLLNGKCVEECVKVGYLDSDNFGVKYCVYCRDENCLKCDINNDLKCLECDEGYSYSELGEKCLKIKTSILKILIIAFAILVSVLVIIVVVLVIIHRKRVNFRNERRKIYEKVKVKKLIFKIFLRMKGKLS